MNPTIEFLNEKPSISYIEYPQEDYQTESSEQEFELLVNGNEMLVCANITCSARINNRYEASYYNPAEQDEEHLVEDIEIEGVFDLKDGYTIENENLENDILKFLNKSYE